jgi:hypothetical protein
VPYVAPTPVGLAEEQANQPPPIGIGHPEVESVVLRGLAADPAERYPDAAAFSVALASAVGQLAAGDVTSIAPVVRPRATTRARERTARAPRTKGSPTTTMVARATAMIADLADPRRARRRSPLGAGGLPWRASRYPDAVDRMQR